MQDIVSQLRSELESAKESGRRSSSIRDGSTPVKKFNPSAYKEQVLEKRQAVKKEIQDKRSETLLYGSVSTEENVDSSCVKFLLL
jgi:hypothetical protein